MPVSPIIVIGMHRSGTSMLTRFLEQAGLFMGARKNTNDEAIFFENLNTWILREANATWDNPYNFQFTNDYFNKKMIEVLRKQLSGYRRIQFVGKSKMFKYGSLTELDFPWGWKDPKNTFTVDLWSKIFPEARILHIHRNPVDVAASLSFREKEHEKNFKLNSKRALKEKVIKGRVSYVISLRVKQIEEGLKLWEDYVGEALRLKPAYHDRWLDIGYEIFLDSPIKEFMKVAEFAGLSVNEAQVEHLCSMVNPERKYSFLKNPELVKHYREIRQNQLVAELGYSEII